MIYCMRCKRYVPDEDGRCLDCMVREDMIDP